MKFTKALRALLVLGSIQQANAQNSVTVTIGESGSNVFMEFAGSLMVLPPSYQFSDSFSQGFFTGVDATQVSAATGSSKCK